MALGFALGLLCGPAGFFYISWKYGLAALSFFVLFSAAGSYLIPFLEHSAPSLFWGILHGIVMGGFIAIAITDRNDAIEKGDEERFLELRSGIWAIIGSISAYRALLWATTAVCGLLTSFRMLVEGRVFAAVFALLIALPLVGLLTGVLFSWISWAVIYLYAGSTSGIQGLRNRK